MQQSGGLVLISSSTLTTPLFSFPSGNEKANKSLLPCMATILHPIGWEVFSPSDILNIISYLKDHLTIG